MYRFRVLPAAALLAVALLSLARTARAEQNVEADIGAVNGDQVEVTLSNPFDFAVKVVGVRLVFEADNGALTYYPCRPGTPVVDLASSTQPGSRWTGTMTFQTDSGEPIPPEIDLAQYTRVNTGSGMEISLVAAPAEAALAGGDRDAIAAELTFIRARIPPVSIAVRLFSAHIDASGLDRAQWFDLDRLDRLRTSLEDALCADASQRLLRAGSQSARETVYAEISEGLREADLQVSCMTGDARMAAARMLIASSRPQDALVFSERDESRNVLPEWRPIFIEAHLALVQSALDLNAETYATFRPAIESLRAVREIDPENRDMLRIEQSFIPRVARWVRLASDGGDLTNVQTMVGLLRPTYSGYPDVEAACGVYAQKLIESGIGFARLHQYINARNEFVRGERILVGIPEWEARRDDINHYRALGVLEEARTQASNREDPDAIERAWERLAEAQDMFRLSDEELGSFRHDISMAFVAAADWYLEDGSWTGADRMLELAESVLAAGRSDEIRDAWLRYAEARYARGGVFMSGLDIEDARRAISKSENFDATRIATLEGQLTVAYYGYRIAIPGLVLLGLLFAGIYRMMSARKAKRMAAEAEL